MLVLRCIFDKMSAGIIGEISQRVFLLYLRMNPPMASFDLSEHCSSSRRESRESSDCFEVATVRGPDLIRVVFKVERCPGFRHCNDFCLIGETGLLSVGRRPLPFIN